MRFANCGWLAATFEGDGEGLPAGPLETAGHPSLAFVGSRRPRSKRKKLGGRVASSCPWTGPVRAIGRDPGAGAAHRMRARHQPALSHGGAERASIPRSNRQRRRLGPGSIGPHTWWARKRIGVAASIGRAHCGQARVLGEARAGTQRDGTTTWILGARHSALRAVIGADGFGYVMSTAAGRNFPKWGVWRWLFRRDRRQLC